MDKKEAHKIYRREYMRRHRKGERYSKRDAEPLIEEKLADTLEKKKAVIENYLDSAIKMSYSINKSVDLFNYEVDYIEELQDSINLINMALFKLKKLV